MSSYTATNALESKPASSFPHLHTAIAHSGLWVRHLLRLRRALRPRRRKMQGLLCRARMISRRCAPRLMLQQRPCENPCCLQKSAQLRQHPLAC